MPALSTAVQWVELQEKETTGSEMQESFTLEKEPSYLDNSYSVPCFERAKQVSNELLISLISLRIGKIAL